MAQGYSEDKAAIQKRLRRIEGQVRGLQRMVEDDRYCIDVLEQVSAATRALQSVALELLDDHLAHCVADAVGRRGGRKPRRADTRLRPPSPRPVATRQSRAASAARTGAGDPAGHPGWIDTVARSLREGFFMFWETLWPLILGFGAVRRRPVLREPDACSRAGGPPAGLGRPGLVLRDGLVVMLLCGPAMAKSIFVKGADFVAVCVFMFASTNLVVELGIVLVVLMGWQFAVSEFVGGIIMIVLLTLAVGLWLRGRLVVGPASG